MLAVQERVLERPAEGPQMVQGLFAVAQDFADHGQRVDLGWRSQALTDQFWHRQMMNEVEDRTRVTWLR